MAPSVQRAPDPPESSGRASVLVAMPDAELAKRVAALLELRGLKAAVVFDGVDAMLETQRQQPKVVVLAADLPKMFGFQVCEVIKRNDSLREIHVVLAGAIHRPDRYRRSPTQLYGADAYVEIPDLPEGLIPILERVGVLGDARVPTEMAPPSVPEAEPRPGLTPREAPPELGLDPPSSAAGPSSDSFPELDDSPGIGGTRGEQADALSPKLPDEDELASAFEPPARDPAPPPAPVGPVAAVGSPEQAEQLAQAERLARIIVSDIVLYNEEKFAAAVGAGNVARSFAAELEEGRGLFDRRIAESVRCGTDFLREELFRVARARGMH